ncbi:LysR family transcriptional regulator [Rhodobacteraceae bacterium NNCM2]|nr:LysR family transcriptional regulator [Coraliihabitans acroporae]
MSQRRFHLPSSNALIAFESVARLGGVGRAAEELNTSQSAISRHLKQLEEHIGVSLFERSGRNIALTLAGRSYLDTVSSALESLNEKRLELRSSGHNVMIACTHAVSHLLIMPRFERLRRALGKSTNIRILTCEYDQVQDVVHAGVDVLFEYRQDRVSGPSVDVLREEITPMASPGFVAAHAEVLRRAPSEWSALPHLALSQNNFGWATWSDWSEATGAPVQQTVSDAYANYVYLLEAASAGAGIALGWRGFVDRYIQTGALVPISENWVQRPTRLSARLTRKGERNQNAQKCLRFLETLFADKTL